ncbi:MAG: hypothetical protein U0840_17970 [Gemmataceae bacterium]
MRVGCEPGSEHLIRTHGQAWVSRQQASLEIVPVKSGLQDDENLDLRILRPAAMPRLAAADRLTTLPDKLAERGDGFDWNGLLSIYREQLLVWDKKTVALPLAGESAVCLYRTDLFSSPEHQTGYSAWLQKRGLKGTLAPPATWVELAQQAEYFRERSNTPSLSALPADPYDLDRLFYQAAAPYVRRAVRQDEGQGPDHLAEVFAFHYDLKTGAPRIATPGFVAALELLQRLQACRPTGTSAHPEEALLAGKAVLAVADSSWILAVQQRPELADKLGFVSLPGSSTYFTPDGQPRQMREGVNRIPYLGGMGWLGVVPRSAKYPDASWSFLAELAGSVRSTQIAAEPSHGGGPTRMEHLLRDRWDAYGLHATAALSLKDILGRHVLQHGLKNPVMVLRIPDEASHRAAMHTALHSVLADKKDPAKALTEAAKAWSALDEARGKERHLREYRLSLGLTAN